MAFADEQIRPFLERQPLYTKVDLELPRYATMMFPDVLELECPECKQSRPFRNPRKGQTGPGFGLGLGGLDPTVTGVYTFAYQCTGCDTATWRCWVEVDSEKGWVRKVGQLPPWSTAIRKDLERHLGDATEHYKRALTCLSQGYGLGACAYMRRVLEDTIDPLLRLELDVRRAEGADAAELEEISVAIKGRTFGVKTEIAYRHAPKSIIVHGNNPLKLIHDKLSIGVHRLPEKECVEIAATLAVALEYVVTALNRQREEKAAFTTAIRQASGEGRTGIGPAQPDP